MSTCKFLKDFARWRKSSGRRRLWRNRKKVPGTVGGRTLDLNKLALDHVLDWAVTEKWLPTKPALEWKKKAKAPKEIRLIPESGTARAMRGQPDGAGTRSDCHVA